MKKEGGEARRVSDQTKAIRQKRPTKNKRATSCGHCRDWYTLRVGSCVSTLVEWDAFCVQRATQRLRTRERTRPTTRQMLQAPATPRALRGTVYGGKGQASRMERERCSCSCHPSRDSSGAFFEQSEMKPANAKKKHDDGNKITGHAHSLHCRGMCSRCGGVWPACAHPAGS